MTNSLPADVLEQRAAEQRRRLHNSVSTLRVTVRERVRERLNFKHQVREHFWPAVGSVSLLGLMVGYAFGAMFTEK